MGVRWRSFRCAGLQDDAIERPVIHTDTKPGGNARGQAPGTARRGRKGRGGSGPRSCRWRFRTSGRVCFERDRRKPRLDGADRKTRANPDETFLLGGGPTARKRSRIPNHIERTCQLTASSHWSHPRGVSHEGHRARGRPGATQMTPSLRRVGPLSMRGAPAQITHRWLRHDQNCRPLGSHVTVGGLPYESPYPKRVRAGAVPSCTTRRFARERIPIESGYVLRGAYMQFPRSSGNSDVLLWRMWAF
jgi:hypothetical protein